MKARGRLGRLYRARRGCSGGRGIGESGFGWNASVYEFVCIGVHSWLDERGVERELALQIRPSEAETPPYFDGETSGSVYPYRVRARSGYKVLPRRSSFPYPIPI
jgi:hypothetical protein